MAPTNLLLNGSFEWWHTSLPIKPFAWDTGGYADMRFEANTTNAQHGGYAVTVTTKPTGAGVIGQRPIPVISDTTNAYLRGYPVSFSVRVKTTTPNRIYAIIGDGLGGTSQSAPHSGSGNWETLTVTRTLDPGAMLLQVYVGSIDETGGSAITFTVDMAMLVPGPVAFGFAPHPRDQLGGIITDGKNLGLGVTQPEHLHHKLVIGSNLHSTADGIALDGVFTFYWGSGVPTPPASWIVYLWLDTDGALKVKFSNGVVRTIASPN
jgi:hypothetical protein